MSRLMADFKKEQLSWETFGPGKLVQTDFYHFPLEIPIRSVSFRGWGGWLDALSLSDFIAKQTGLGWIWQQRM